MAWTLDTLFPLDEPSSVSLLSDWNLDEERRSIAHQQQTIRSLEDTVKTLQETIRSSTGLAVKAQRALQAKERRIRELESTVRLLEGQLAACRAKAFRDS